MSLISPQNMLWVVIESFKMSNHNIRFCCEIRKYLSGHGYENIELCQNYLLANFKQPQVTRIKISADNIFKAIKVFKYFLIIIQTK